MISLPQVHCMGFPSCSCLVPPFGSFEAIHQNDKVREMAERTQVMHFLAERSESAHFWCTITIKVIALHSAFHLVSICVEILSEKSWRRATGIVRVVMGTDFFTAISRSLAVYKSLFRSGRIRNQRCRARASNSRKKFWRENSNEL